MATIRQAAGLELPFGRQDVWANLLFGAGGMVAVIGALKPHELPQQWGLVPLILMAIVHVVRMRVKHHRGARSSPGPRRGYTISLVGALVAGGVMLFYRV